MAALVASRESTGHPKCRDNLLASSQNLLSYGLSSFQTTSFSLSPSDGQQLEDILLVAQGTDGAAPSWEPCLFRYEKDGAVSVRVVLDIASENRGNQDDLLTLAEPPSWLDVNWSKPFVTAPWTPFQLDEGGVGHFDSCSNRSHSNSGNDFDPHFSSSNSLIHSSLSGDSLDSIASRCSCPKSTRNHFQGMWVYPFQVSYTARHRESSDGFATEALQHPRQSLTLAATDPRTREKWMNNLAQQAHADKMMTTLAFALERMASFHDSDSSNGNSNGIGHGPAAATTAAAAGTSMTMTMTMTSPFHSADAPDIGLADYLQRLREYMGCSIECFVIGLVYIDRLAKQYSKIISPKSVHRLVIAAMVLAAKFQDDNIYFNDHYAQVGGITLQELNSLECHLLELLHWKLYVSEKEFDLYRELLCCSGRASAE